MPLTPGSSSKRPAAEPLSSVTELQALYGASSFARYAKFLAPGAVASRLVPKQPPRSQEVQKPSGTRPVAPQSPQQNAAPYLPATPPRKRQRTAAKQTAESPPPSTVELEVPPKVVQVEQSAGGPLPEETNQEQVENGEQATQDSSAFDLGLHMARPLTKRQEVIATKKQEEAAATLAGARQHSPLPDEVGDALMDFAEAAELAELEDKAEEQRFTVGSSKLDKASKKAKAQRKADKIAKRKADKSAKSSLLSNRMRAGSSETQTTVTQSDVAVHSDEGVGDEQMSPKKHKSKQRRVKGKPVM